MKQEEQKKLLLKDLCARVPYNLVVQIEDCGIWNLRGVDHDDSAELRDRVIVWYGKDYPSSKNSFPIINCKPYLFPLSSITEEQEKELSKLGVSYCEYALHDDIRGLGIMVDEAYIFFEFCYKHHIDFLGLIDMGLAIDCTNLNIY